MARLWVLGASDPEMAAIEKLLTGLGEAVAGATVDGKPVHPGNAYQADGWAAINFPTYQVECDVGGDPQLQQLVQGGGLQAPTSIDHHREGDPGWGRPPAEYWEASSIGQVVAELFHLGVLDTCEIDELPIPDARLIAASDHCPAAAYRGECPGVEPDELMEWRASTRAAFQGRPVAEFLVDIKSAREMLETAPILALDQCETCLGNGEHHTLFLTCTECQGTRGRGLVRDMRAELVPELPEAALRDGVAYIAIPATGGRRGNSTSSGDPRRKVVLGGHTTEEHRKAWPKFAEFLGLTDCYGGDVARGFAGGYLPASPIPADRRDSDHAELARTRLRQATE